MNANVIRVNPSGNITLLVTTPVPRKDQSKMANRLMQADPGAEQVGFLEEAALPGAAARLQMMGGEFCGNATMSTAAFLAQRDGLADGETRLYPLEVSGADGIIPCRMIRRGNRYTGTVPMPLPQEITELEILPGKHVPLVRFAGIDHAIVPEDMLKRKQAEDMIAHLCAQLNSEAMGILLLDVDGKSIRPLVYVRSTDSAVWENSCGSGTAAVGAWQAFVQKGDVQLEIAQPCPDTCIVVSARYVKGRVSALEITGSVCIENEYSARL